MLIDPTTRTALVLGITGGAGGAIARALAARGWHIRALTRDPDGARQRLGDMSVAWVAGDAMNRSDVIAAAAGARVIVHGVNPPNYRDWRGLAIPMLANAIAAADASGARLVLPGNIYNFDPADGPLLGETTPQRARTRKGRIRVEMEQMLRDAAGRGVRSLVLRAGDFFGPGATSTWFAQAVAKRGYAATVIEDPAAPGIGHAWAYLPDFGETVARLVEDESRLAPAEVLHFGGHWLPSSAPMVEAVRQATGRPDLRVRRFPWIAVWLGAPFVGFLREMIEMRYLWRVPLRLGNARLVGLLGEEPHTPLVDAVRVALDPA